MSAHVSYEKPLKVVGPDGTTIWIGGATLGLYYWAVASEAISEQMGVMIDPTSVIPRGDYTATDTIPTQSLLVLKSTATLTQGVPLGVALNNAAAGAPVLVAGPGSVVAVRMTNAGSVGSYMIGNATAGSLTSNATATAGITYGLQVRASITGGPSGTRGGIFVGAGSGP